jgi:zinc D-Ala-D-Ala carboxypeptidase
MNNISSHISFKEAAQSPTALRYNINNTPDEATLKRMTTVANKCFEPLREWYGKPIKINSFYRCPELNTKVGGSKTSEHVLGQAIDIDTDSVEENKKLFDWCKKNLQFNQLIWEYNGAWIHISYKESGNKNQILEIR